MTLELKLRTLSWSFHSYTHFFTLNQFIIFSKSFFTPLNYVCMYTSSFLTNEITSGLFLEYDFMLKNHKSAYTSYT